MGFKGVYKNKSGLTKFTILVILFFVSFALHTVLSISLIMLFSDSGIHVIKHQDLNNQTSINYLKFMQMLTSIGMFIVPTLLYSYLTNFDFKFSRITRQSVILIAAIMLLITPFISFILEWNMSIPFPNWLLQFDMNSEALIDAFLRMENIKDLLYTLLVIAVVPAIGEELLFRGYLQQKIGIRLKNNHSAIFLTAFLFSVIHFDIQGIIPRFILGLLLGYLFYWSNSLWMPILAHFLNNAQAVILSFPPFKIDDGPYSISTEASSDLLLATLSLGSVILLLYILYMHLAIIKKSFKG